MFKSVYNEEKKCVFYMLPTSFKSHSSQNNYNDGTQTCYLKTKNTLWGVHKNIMFKHLTLKFLSQTFFIKRYYQTHVLFVGL